VADLIISFSGIDADRGQLEAFAGIESAAGLARALTLIGHYAGTGKIRRRFPFDQTVQFYLDGTEEGSFNWKFVVSIGGPLALGLATNGLYDLIKLVFNKAATGDEVTVSAPVEELNEKKSGDIDALVEAVEPALKKAHYGIGETAKKITIVDSRTKTIVVEFNDASKSYLLDSIPARDESQDVIISSLNVNDRTGRAYFVDLGRTIPFKISRDAHPGTMSTLSANLKRYADRKPVHTAISFTRIEAVDGRLKRIIIFGAQDASDEL
jgi:hypothetical protein